MPASRQRLALVTEQRQLLCPEQILKTQGVEWRDTIVGTVFRAVRTKIAHALQNGKVRELSASSHGVDFLSARLAHEALCLAGQAMMDTVLENAASQTGAEVIAKLQTSANDASEDIVNMWASNPHIYTPLAASPGGKSYADDLENFARMDPSERPHDHVPELRAAADEYLPSAVDPSYHVLREATFREGTPADVPRIAASYRSAMLTSETLGILERRPMDRQEEIVDRIEEFRKRMHKGVFIWDLDEREMIDDLNGKSVDETGYEYRIRLIESQKGDVLAWMTYLHNPLHANDRQRKKIRRKASDYLMRGVTGKMQYDDSTPQQLFKDDMDRTQLFLDIRSHHPGAAKRLGALAYQEMLQDNHHINHILAYRLYDLHIQPPLSLGTQTRERGILPAVNDSSGDLFRSWMFRHVAFDRNDKQGDHWAKRANVAGVDRAMSMKWDVMAGRLEDVEASATSLWKKAQINHGDTSHDFIAPRSKKFF